MSLLELSFESQEGSLSVRRFAVHEAMSSLFSVSIWARSPNDDIDLESIVGQAASLRAVSGMKYAQSGSRCWTGVCSHMEQVHAESTGLSTYYLRIVPKLWLLTQRVNHRIFQHLSVPDIVMKMLGEWSIDHALKVDGPRYPKLEIRSQYGESDFDFMSRLLEEAGISYSFADHQEKGSVLTLHDAPHTNEPREGGPIDYVDNPNQAAEKEFLSSVRLSQRVRPGKVTLRDFDFRRQPTFKFFGDHSLGKGIEERLEVYRYEPASFLVELEGKEADALKGLAGSVLPKMPGLPSVLGMPEIPGVPSASGLPGVLSVGGAAGAVAKAGKDVAAGVKAAGSLAQKVEETAGSLAEKAKKKVGDAVEGKVQGYVEKSVGGIAEGKLGKVAGEKAAGLVGNLAGGVGGVAGKVAGFVAGGLAGQVVGGLSGLGGLGGLFGKLVGDDKGMARFSEKVGIERAMRQLESARASRRNVTFESNVMDLSPGTVFSIGKHARKDLADDKKLLVTEFSIEGSHDGEWNMSAQAQFADVPHRPPMKTPKPQIQGLQSAVVVGPAGEEIHTDEFGRVRVQFHWDREGAHDEGSSCWMRVSQGWAGSGFGMIALPRVGQEVLVAFLEGNADHPVVVGRLFNATSPVPYDLPANKTKSGWKSDSSPGSNGFNELMFEDAKGRELVYVQAERDLEKLVKRNEAIAVGNDRRTSIGAVDESHVGVRHNVTMRQAEGGEGDSKTGPTFFEMIDKRIHLSTGEASITLDGPNITLAAKGRIFIHSSDDDVEILGGPWVKINCGPAPEEGDTVTSHHITGIVRDQDGKPAPDMKVVVKSSDGAIQQVTTDSSGRYFALVPPGKCQVSIPGTLRYGTPGSKVDDMTVEPQEADDCGPAV